MHDAAHDREEHRAAHWSSDDDPPSGESDAHDAVDERGRGHDDASGDDWDWFSAA